MESYEEDLFYILGKKLINSEFIAQKVDQLIIGDYTIKDATVHQGTGILLYDIPFIDDRIKKGDRVTVHIITDHYPPINEDDLPESVNVINYYRGSNSYIIVEDHDSSRFDSIHNISLSKDDKLLHNKLDDLCNADFEQKTAEINREHIFLVDTKLNLEDRIRSIKSKMNRLLFQDMFETKNHLISIIFHRQNDNFANYEQKLKHSLDQLIEEEKLANKELEEFNKTYDAKMSEFNKFREDCRSVGELTRLERSVEFLSSCPLYVKCYKTNRVAEIKGLHTSNRPDFSKL